MSAFPLCLKACVKGSINLYPLRLLTILDSGASINITNNITKLKSFRKPFQKEYLITEDSIVLIEGYRRVDLPIIRPDSTKDILRIKNAAYCPSCTVNIVSFYILYK